MVALQVTLPSGFTICGSGMSKHVLPSGTPAQLLDIVNLSDDLPIKKPVMFYSYVKSKSIYNKYIYIYIHPLVN
jgi:hypothetical protein